MGDERSMCVDEDPKTAIVASGDETSTRQQQQQEAVFFQQFLNGCSRLENVEEIQLWLSNFERKCKLFGISDSKKTEAALLSMGDEIFASLKSRVVELGKGCKLASSIPWKTLRKGLLSLTSDDYPLMAAMLKLLRLSADLGERKVPIDTAWREMCDAFDAVYLTAEDELGAICEDVDGLTEQQRGEVEISLRLRLRKMILTTLLLSIYPVAIPVERSVYALAPEKVFEQVRAIRIAAGRPTPK